MTALGPLKLKAIRDQWIAAGLVRTQINAKVRRVRRMLAGGVEQELVPPAVLQALKAVPGLRRGRTEARESRRIQPVPDAYVDAVRPFVSRQVWAMIELQRLAGMRPAEVCLMRTIDINTAGAIREYRPRRHKTEHHERERIVPLDPRAQEVLRPWLRTALEEYLFQPLGAAAEHRAEMRRHRKTKVQPSQRDRSVRRPKRAPGEHYSTISYGHAIADACDRAGVPRWPPNQLRHNAATRIRREFGLETAKAVLGHSSVVPTRIHAEQGMEAARRAMEELG